MTLNTRENLAAAAGVAFLPLGPNVTPFGARTTPGAGPVDSEWLQSAGWGYPGIVPAGGAVVVPSAETVRFVYRRRRRLKAQKRSI